MRTDYENLSPRRREVLMFIHAEVDAGRGFPSRTQIADHMGWPTSSSNTYDALMTLAGAGYITRWHARYNRNRWEFGLLEGAEHESRKVRT